MFIVNLLGVQRAGGELDAGDLRDGASGVVAHVVADGSDVSGRTGVEHGLDRSLGEGLTSVGPVADVADQRDGGVNALDSGLADSGGRGGGEDSNSNSSHFD